jgi:prefoldin subunit 5
VSAEPSVEERLTVLERRVEALLRLADSHATAIAALTQRFVDHVERHP